MKAVLLFLLTASFSFAQAAPRLEQVITCKNVDTGKPYVQVTFADFQRPLKATIPATLEFAVDGQFLGGERVGKQSLTYNIDNAAARTTYTIENRFWWQLRLTEMHGDKGEITGEMTGDIATSLRCVRTR